MPRHRLEPLRSDGLDPDPLVQFGRWFEQAEREVPLPEAMTLATVDADGRPDARMVLLKGFGTDGFRFFSNYESAKGRQLAERPRAALVIYWRELDRQVRVAGPIARLSVEDSDSYFASRPRDSQVAAAASPQSEAIEGRDWLERRVREIEQANPDALPRPSHWGGYVLEPESIEFWQGGPGRLHDRFRYARGDSGGWRLERLAP
ncbi:MAG: pyridoxamine 5'-phosphate oxidase [Solirubrobacterales bacterium]|nr:pyridoxamine 5'-phosphate oxidase [Solirubrobacterales bacterium]